MHGSLVLDCFPVRRQKLIALLWAAVRLEDAAGRRFFDSEDIYANESTAAAFSSCPWGYKPKLEHLHMDFPGEVVGKSNAVYLLHDPHTPTIVIHQNSVWNFWRAPDEKGLLGGDVVYDARQPKGAAPLPSALLNQKFNLQRDMVSLKFYKRHAYQKAKVVFKHECKEAELRQATKKLTAGSARQSGRGRRGRLSRRGSPGVRGSSNSFIEEEVVPGGADGKTCTKELVEGQFYDDKQVEAAMSKMGFEKKKAVDAIRSKEFLSEGVRSKLKDVSNVSFSPLLARNGLVATGGGAIGFTAILPGLILFQDPGIIFGPIGAIIGVAASLALAQKSVGHQSNSAAELIFHKLWCMSYHDTCTGKPCFTRCHDAQKNPYLVPYGKYCNDPS